MIRALLCHSNCQTPEPTSKERIGRLPPNVRGSLEAIAGLCLVNTKIVKKITKFSEYFIKTMI